jgi:uncharacterized membrane protein
VKGQPLFLLQGSFDHLQTVPYSKWRCSRLGCFPGLVVSGMVAFLAMSHSGNDALGLVVPGLVALGLAVLGLVAPGLAGVPIFLKVLLDHLV